MPRFNGDVIFTDTSGQVRSTNGDLTLRADGLLDENGIVNVDIIAGSGKHFRPEYDGLVLGSGMDCGANARRWRMIWGISGVFNSRPYIQDLGDYVAVQSDIVQPVDGVTSLNTLLFDLTLDSLNSAISITDDGSFTISFEGKLPVDFRTVSGSIIPDKDSAYGLGAAAKAWSAFYTNIDVDAGNDRPAMNSSGMATINDLTIVDRAAMSNSDLGITNATYQKDSISMFPDTVPTTRKCKVASRFGLSVTHGHFSAPSDWQLLVVKRKKDLSSVHAASGWFSWDPGVFVDRLIGGNLETDPVEKFFEPGDGYYFILHNDGSGTVIDNIFSRCSIEFTVNEDSGGINYFEQE